MSLSPADLEENMNDLFDNDHTLAALHFIEQNPIIFETFCQRAKQLKNHGYKHGGAKDIWESMRRDARVQSNDDKIKLNNNYVTTFAILAMKRCPDLKGFFQVRMK